MSNTPINIIAADSAGEYRLRLQFDDGVVRVVDFFPFLARSRHPAIRAYIDPERFAGYRLEYGDLVWGDYDLCFPLIDLYQNRIVPPSEHESAA